MGVGLIESPWGVRWTSLATLALILIVVTAARRRPLLALAAAMGWLVSYEIAFEGIDILAHQHYSQHLPSWGFWLLTVVGWPFFAHAIGIRPDWRWALASGLVFLIWIQQGFWYNWAGQAGPIQWEYEALNVGSKTALGVAYLLGALNPSGSQLEDLKRSLNQAEGLWRGIHSRVQLNRPGPSSQGRDEQPAG